MDAEEEMLCLQMVEALSRGRGSVGIVHLAMHATEAGLVQTWTHEVEAVAEPSMFSTFTILPFQHARPALALLTCQVHARRLVPAVWGMLTGC